MDYKELEGKIEAAHILAAIIDNMGGKYEMPATRLFANVQVDKMLVLNYNEENATFELELQEAKKEVIENDTSSDE